MKAKQDLSYRNNPFLLGFALTPLGGVVGAFVLVFGASDGAGGDFGIRIIFSIVFGIMIGWPFALPVTFILFPLMHRLRPPAWTYPLAGGALGLMLYPQPFSAAATVGGVATGLVFAFVNRDLSLREDCTPPDGANGT